MFPPIRRSVAACAIANLIPAFTASTPSETTPGFHAAEPELRAYLTGALDRNPELRAARAAYRAARERVPQAGALPEPVLGLTRALRSVETRVGPQTGGLTLTQAFPWFGTRALRGRVALYEAAAERRLYEAAEREVIAQVKRAYYELGYLDAARRLADEEEWLLAHYETLARARYAAGEGLQQAVIRLQAELTRVQDRRFGLDRSRLVVAARLNALCQLPVGTPAPSVPALARPAPALDSEALYELGERDHRELLAAAARVEGGEGAVALAHKRARPRFTASLALTNVAGRDDPAAAGPLPPDEGKNALTVSVGMSLPIWRTKYRAGIAEAEAELAGRRRRLEAVRSAMELTVRQSLDRLQALDRQIGLLDTVLIPQSEEALRSTEAAYETGQLGVVELLDSERVLLDIRQMRARYLSDYLIALAELEAGIGGPVPLGEESG